MSENWKYTTKLLFWAAIVVVVLASIAYFFSINLSLLASALFSLVGSWVKRKQLPSIISRAKVIIGVVFGTAAFFGFLLWYIHGDVRQALTLVVGTAAVIILTLGSYDHIIPNAQQDKNLKDKAFEIQPISIEEQQQCPNCQAVISRNAGQCSWCGKSF
jgi:hypothetical protein